LRLPRHYMKIENALVADLALATVA
jgi:hypothetical protein